MLVSGTIGRHVRLCAIRGPRVYLHTVMSIRSPPPRTFGPECTQNVELAPGDLDSKPLLLELAPSDVFFVYSLPNCLIKTHHISCQVLRVQAVRIVVVVACTATAKQMLKFMQ